MWFIYIYIIIFRSVGLWNIQLSSRLQGLSTLIYFHFHSILFPRINFVHFKSKLQKFYNFHFHFPRINLILGEILCYRVTLTSNSVCRNWWETKWAILWKWSSCCWSWWLMVIIMRKTKRCCQCLEAIKSVYANYLMWCYCCCCSCSWYMVGVCWKWGNPKNVQRRPNLCSGHPKGGEQPRPRSGNITSLPTFSFKYNNVKNSCWS